MYSDDQTCKIAEELGARIIYHKRTGFVEPARYYAISEAKYDWVLVLDADERMTEKLGSRLFEVVEDNIIDVVSFWSLFWYFGGWVRHGGFFSPIWTRFFKKSIYIETYNENEELVHQNFKSLSKVKNKITLSSEYYILHYAYPSIDKYINKTVAKYALIEAEQYYNNGRKFSILYLILIPIKEFIVRYLIKRGFLDGIRGFILAVLFASFKFSIWSNYWFIREQNKSTNNINNG